MADQVLDLEADVRVEAQRDAAGPDRTLQAQLALADPASGAHVTAGIAAARQAQVLARQAGDALAHDRASTWLCVQLMRLGEHQQVQQEALALLPRLSAQGSVLLSERREVLNCLVMASIEIGAFDTALDAARQLVVLAEQYTADATASLLAAYAMAVCLERMGDSWQALRVVRAALQAHLTHLHESGEAASAAATQALSRCLNAQCAVSIGLFHRIKDVDPPHELRALLLEARAAAEQVHSLNQSLGDERINIAVSGNLAEVLLHLGELERAEQLLAGALEKARRAGMRAYAWRLQTTLADWYLAGGRTGAARQLAEGLIAEMDAQAPMQTVIRARQAAYRACRAAGEFEAALLHFEVMERLERERAASQLRAQSELFVTRSEVQQAQSQVEHARREALRERRRADEQARQAEMDALTGLGNRRYVNRRWAELVASAGTADPSQQALAVALVDVDHFKRINDCYGHATGDQVLVELAALMRQVTRSGDIVARLGGEEFVLVLPDLSPTAAEEACQRLRVAVHGHDWSHLFGAGAALSVSLGVAASPPLDLELLLQRADQALYRAKAEGRNRVCMHVAPTFGAEAAS
jgi:diguanylate cyclase